MNGYSSHTLKLVNGKGEEFYAKWHFKTDQGIRNLTGEQATALVGTDPDYATRDLYDAIRQRQYPSWTVNLQVYIRLDPALIVRS
jgi:catalase